MSSLWARLRSFIADLYAREPVMVTAVITSVVTSALAWVLSTGVFDLTDAQQQTVITTVVGFVLALLAGAGVARAKVYSPATVGRLIDSVRSERSGYDDLSSDTKADAAYHGAEIDMTRGEVLDRLRQSEPVETGGPFPESHFTPPDKP